VVIGGCTANFNVVDVTGSVEIYDPATGHWSITGSLHTARMNHTATLLPDGTILVAAGYNGDAVWLRDCEIYDPATGTSRVVAPLAIGRMDHEAALLPSGKVMVAGGRIGGAGGTYLRSVELYDPATDSWSTIDSMAQSRISGFAMTLFSDATLLVAGGRSGPITAGPAAELLETTPLTWTSVSPIKVSVAWPGGAMIPNDRYLMTGGFYDADWASPQGIDVTATPTCEWYDKMTGTWFYAPQLNTQRGEHGAVFVHQEVNPDLPVDLALVCGGITGGADITATAEVLDVTVSALEEYEARQSVLATVQESGAGETSLSVLGNGGPRPALKLMLAHATEVSGRISSVTGEQVAQIPAQMLEAGDHVLPIDLASLAGGTYLVRLDAPQGPQFCKVTITR
jgi:hypothetical protein